MNEQQKVWARARDGLADELNKLGYPRELADLLARQLRSPRAIDRMASYVRQARPRSVEMLADEMLAITAEIDAWRDRRESQDAQAAYNAWLFYRKTDAEEEAEE